MKFLKILAIIFLVIFALFMAFAPTEIDVKESITIDAHPDVVYAQFNNMNNWQEWLPLKKADPSMEVTLGKPIEGEGANYSWVSEQMGNGSFKIAEAEKNEYQVQEISMMDSEPFNARFDMESIEEGKVSLSWSMKSEIGFFDIGGRLFAIPAPMMLSESFKNGLNDIKTIAEEIKVPYKNDIVRKQMPELLVMVNIDSCAINSDQMKKTYEKTFTDLLNYISVNKIEHGVKAITYVVKWDPENDKYVFEAGIPVMSADSPTTDEFYLKTLEAGDYVVCTHTGSYEYFPNSHEDIMKYIFDNGLEMGGNPYEIYENDPTTVSEYEAITTIAYPVKG